MSSPEIDVEKLALLLKHHLENKLQNIKGLFLLLPLMNIIIILYVFAYSGMDLLMFIQHHLHVVYFSLFSLAATFLLVMVVNTYIRSFLPSELDLINLMESRTKDKEY